MTAREEFELYIKVGEEIKLIKYYLGLGQWSGNGSGLRCGGLLLDAGRGNGAQDCTATASSGQRLFLALLFLQLFVYFLFPVDLEGGEGGGSGYTEESIDGWTIEIV